MRTICLLILLCCLSAGAETISFWHALSGQREQQLAKLVERFQVQNPDIQVELKAFRDPRGQDYACLYRSLLQALGEKSPPVVSMMYENWVSQLADHNVLTRLDHHLQAAWNDMPAILLKASTHRDGHRYSVPFNKSLWTLYANRDWRESKQPPQNWSELRLACADLATRFPTGSLGVPSPFELFSMHFVSQGGRFFDPQGRASFAGPIGLASAGYLSGLQQDRACIFGQAGYSRFIQGQLPFLLDTSSKLSQLEEKLGDRLEVLPLPRGAGDRIQLSGTQLSVFEASSHSQRRAGVRLLRFLSSPEVTREWSMATGYLPIRQSVYQDPAYLEFLRAKPERALLLSSLPRAQVQPQIVGWEATRIIINDALERTLYQQRPVDAELTQAQATSAKLIRSLQGKN